MRLEDSEVGRGTGNEPASSEEQDLWWAQSLHRSCCPSQSLFTASFEDTESLLPKSCLQGAFPQSLMNPAALAPHISIEFRS